MWRQWRHVTKLDPAKEISDKDLKILATSGTDMLLIGGTQDVTRQKVASLTKRLEPYDVVKVQEPSSPENVVFEGVDYYFIPSVMNSQDPRWIVGFHMEWIRGWRTMLGELPWEKIVGEAYIVLNPNSAVARATKSRTDLEVDEAVAYAKCAEKYLHFPIIYIEYSGTYGNPKLVEQVRQSLAEAHLFYGGGIDNRQRASEMAKYATIIVGNILYEDMDRYLETLRYE
ncbi:MAG: heptaprenylglyceryl phosphate synthase [archaeon]